MATIPFRDRVDRFLPLLAGLFIAGLFLFFTRHAPFVYYSHDDLMNLYGYWSKPFPLLKANVLFWEPYYRPFGAIIYRTVFSLFGLDPRPLYFLYFAVIFGNLWIAYLLFRRLSGSRETAGIAMLLFAFHGKLASLYYSAGAMYDVFCFLFFSSALLIYLQARTQNRLPGIWRTLGVLASFVLALDSKEMAATLPVIILIYDLIFHPPEFRGISNILRWCRREGRTALLAAICLLAYLPARLGAGGIAHLEGYVPIYTWDRWFEETGLYLADVIYRNNPFARLGVTPLGPLGILLFFAAAMAIALWARSRVVWFGLLFFVVTLQPVSFIAPRLGFVLYLPLAGLALAAAACLVRVKEALVQSFFSTGLIPSRTASIALFAATALAMLYVDHHFAPPAPRAWFSPYKKTLDQFSRLYPTLPHGAKLLFARTPLDDEWDMVFLLRLYYRDMDLFITQLDRRRRERIALSRLPRYDHVFDFDDGRYVELNNADALLSIQLHLLKGAPLSAALGELMIVGTPGADRYIVKDVLAAGAKADGYWTLDRPELRFRLSSAQHDVFREHFYIPAETLKQTGPLVVDFYINGHWLDQARFATDGEVVYQHRVPAEWLKGDRPETGGLTTVEMRVHNPYIAPGSGARLGVVLRSAVFAPGESS